jgi:hypothetical protein
MKSIIKSNVFSLSALLLLTFILIYITDRYILTVNFYETSGDPLAGIPGQEKGVYESLQKWIYLSSVLYIVIKILLIALILYTGLYLSDHPVPFDRIFNVTILSEFIFLVPAAVKFFWFHLEYPEGTLSDWHRIYILSALSLFESAPADWYYVLQTLNIFELGYWFSLAFGIYRISGMSYDQSLKIVLVSYLPALFIWMATVTFFTLMLFPATG